MKKNDIFFACIILLISFISFFLISVFTKSGDTVKITVDGKIYAELPLLTDCEFPIENSNTIVIENGEVYMKSATCKDKLCMHMGKIKDSSKKIICLPSKVIVEVTKKSDIDMVVK